MLGLFPNLKAAVLEGYFQNSLQDIALPGSIRACEKLLKAECVD